MSELAFEPITSGEVVTMIMIFAFVITLLIVSRVRPVQEEIVVSDEGDFLCRFCDTIIEAHEEVCQNPYCMNTVHYGDHVNHYQVPMAGVCSVCCTASMVIYNQELDDVVCADHYVCSKNLYGEPFFQKF